MSADTTNREDPIMTEPTQPLTDDPLAGMRKRVAAYEGSDHYRYTVEGIEYDGHWAHDARRLLAEVDRLRAELDSMTKFAEDLREERDRRLRAEGERGVERDALAAKVEAAAELHLPWFCETCNSPGPCLTRVRLGVDHDAARALGVGDSGEQANG